MAKEKGRKKGKIKKPQKGKIRSFEINEDQDFDFGGFPDGIDLKKNLGCGG
jgi:hypothetical protein